MKTVRQVLVRRVVGGQKDSIKVSQRIMWLDRASLIVLTGLAFILLSLFNAPLASAQQVKRDPHTSVGPLTERDVKLLAAVQKNDTVAVSKLLATGADLYVIDRDRRTALTIAAFEGFYDVLALFIKQGADVNDVDGTGNTPLLSALDNRKHVAGRAKTVRLLLSKGANANVHSGYGMARQYALTLTGDPVIVNLLVDKGANVNVNGYFTPLMLAAGAGQLETMKILLAHGASVNAKDSKGQTALNWAKNGKGKNVDQVVKLLKAHGAKE